MTGQAERACGVLAYGDLKRIELAVALANTPKLLLMDEPVGALDALTREQMNLDLLDVWSETRKTVILVTHSIDEAVFLEAASAKIRVAR